MNKRTLRISDEAEQFLINGTLDAMKGGILASHCDYNPDHYEIELEMSLDVDGVISTGVHLKLKEIDVKKTCETCRHFVDTPHKYYCEIDGDECARYTPACSKFVRRGSGK